MSILDEVIKKRGEDAEHLFKDLRLKNASRISGDAIFLRKSKESLKQSCAYSLIQRLIDTNPEKAQELLERLGAFDKSEQQEEQGFKTTDDLSF